MPWKLRSNQLILSVGAFRSRIHKYTSTQHYFLQKARRMVFLQERTSLCLPGNQGFLNKIDLPNKYQRNHYFQRYRRSGCNDSGRQVRLRSESDYNAITDRNGMRWPISEPLKRTRERGSLVVLCSAWFESHYFVSLVKPYMEVQFYLTNMDHFVKMAKEPLLYVLSPITTLLWQGYRERLV